MTDTTHARSVPDFAAPVPARRADRETSILIVDDEPGIRSFLQRALAKEFGLVESVDNVDSAEALCERCRFDVLIVDISLPGRSGLDWVTALHHAGDPCDVIFITAYADLNATIGAIRAGAADFILKPFRVEQLLTAVKRCVARRIAPAPHAARTTAPQDGDGEMIGAGGAMQQLRRLIERVAPTPAPVLIEGETGTGKELAATALHRASGRRGPLVAINCVAISPELFESELFGHIKGAFTGAHQAREGLFVTAKGGTLFLDEISEMPPPMQAKLLRALETLRVRPVGADHEIPVDVRLITATNRDLTSAVRTGAFREDLYFRLNVVNLKIPSLRDRGNDIPELLAHFSRKLSRELGLPGRVFTTEEIARLQSYRWPGNIRELRNIVERALLLGEIPWETLGLEPHERTVEPTATPSPLDWTLDAVEKRHALQVLSATRGNKSEAARRLGISRKTLERKLAAWPETRRATE